MPVEAERSVDAKFGALLRFYHGKAESQDDRSAKVNQFFLPIP